MLNQLRNDPDFVPELDFVMEKDGKLIGQNIFVRTAIKADDGRNVPIMTMGPICITPELKRKGYGKLLQDTLLMKRMLNNLTENSRLRKSSSFRDSSSKLRRIKPGGGEMNVSPPE